MLDDEALLPLTWMPTQAPGKRSPGRLFAAEVNRSRTAARYGIMRSLDKHERGALWAVLTGAGLSAVVLLIALYAIHG
jgi:hypothetical protein